MSSQASQRRPLAARRRVAALAAAMFAASLPGCGGGGVSAPPPPAPTPVTTVVQEGSLSLGPDRVTWGGFQTARTGDLEVIVDWTSPANNVDLFLTRGFCDPEQLLAGTCIVVGSAESPTRKPERMLVTHSVAGLFTLFVVNLGPTAESISYQVLLTYTPAAASEPVFR